MRKAPLVILIVASAVVVGFLAAVYAGAMPLGVRGEWEWLRLPAATPDEPLRLVLAGVGVAAYAVFAAAAFKLLERRTSIGREVMVVSALAVVSVGVQAAAQTGAPPGYDLAKWVLALHNYGSSGYFDVARAEARDLRAFLAAYPTWIKSQDALHIGTHPPGLIATEAIFLETFRSHPAAARFIIHHVPDSVYRSFRVFDKSMALSPAGRATLGLTGMVTLLACGLTVVPLYILIRTYGAPIVAWSSAALWPLVPSAVMFQPAADTAFPLLSTTALALVAHALNAPVRRGVWPAFAAGLTLGLGMQFSLAFLAVGLVVASVIACTSEKTVVEKCELLLAVGLGFLAVTVAVWIVTMANPFAIWWMNQKNHARFYVEYSRSYRAWLVANPIELAIGLGLPASIWLVLGFLAPRAVPRVSIAALGVLVLLTVTGRNLSEVARLWLPLMPALLVASGFALVRFGGGSKTLGATILLLGVQTLALQTLIQVVYPV